MSSERPANTHTLSELLRGKPETVAVLPNDRAVTALAHMGQNDYSQLPVIDAGRAVRGLITYESIMRAMLRFDCGVKDLQVSVAMVVKVEKHSPDDDLLDLLPILERTGAVLVVDAGDRLLGIITSYDVMDYFRRRAENMMLVEDIEMMVRELINYAFTDASGTVDKEQRQSAIINRNVDCREDLRVRFTQALDDYLQKSGVPNRVNTTLADASFVLLDPGPPGKSKDFDQLTLNEYITIVCNRDRWSKLYQPHLAMDAARARRLLEKVRDIRNGLAHFRHDVTPEEHDLLRFCADWLSNHMPGIPVGWPVADEAAVNVVAAEEVHVAEAAATALSPAVDGVELRPTPDQVATVEEMIDPGESRYARLAIWLSNRPGRTKEIQLKFDDVEAIIGGALPPSAREHRSWWGNEAVTHVQSQQWLDAGWRVSYLNLSEQRVTFVRTAGRERSYIAFFGGLLEKLRQDGRTSTKGLSPGGQSWYTVSGLAVEGRELAWLNVSFARKERLRVELYIDTGDQDRNKAAFDLLQAQAEKIETEFGEGLTWERLDEARASRVACYREGSITQLKNHEALQAWAVEMLARFQRVIVPAASEALKQAVRRER
jgi:CBS domain-containing protein